MKRPQLIKKLAVNKRILLITIAVIGALIVLVALLVSLREDNDKTQNAVVPAKKTCKILSFNSAYILLGKTVSAANTDTSALDINTDDYAVSRCAYEQSEKLSPEHKVTEIVAYTAKNDKVKKNLVKQFSSYPKEDWNTAYSEYGYWDKDRGQLNILKGNTWYVMEYGPAKAKDRTESQTQDMADLVFSRL